MLPRGVSGFRLAGDSEVGDSLCGLSKVFAGPMEKSGSFDFACGCVFAGPILLDRCHGINRFEGREPENWDEPRGTQLLVAWDGCLDLVDLAAMSLKTGGLNRAGGSCLTALLPADASSFAWTIPVRARVTKASLQVLNVVRSASIIIESSWVLEMSRTDDSYCGTMHLIAGSIAGRLRLSE